MYSTTRKVQQYRYIVVLVICARALSHNRNALNFDSYVCQRKIQVNFHFYVSCSTFFLLSRCQNRWYKINNDCTGIFYCCWPAPVVKTPAIIETSRTVGRMALIECRDEGGDSEIEKRKMRLHRVRERGGSMRGLRNGRYRVKIPSYCLIRTKSMDRERNKTYMYWVCMRCTFIEHNYQSAMILCCLLKASKQWAKRGRKKVQQ